MRALNLSPQCAMAIYAHPDDADVAAGGLLAQWAQDGCAVHLVVVCDGDKGSHALTADAGAVREVRDAEVEFAADLSGAATVTRLERPDGEVDERRGAARRAGRADPSAPTGGRASDRTRRRRSSPGST